MKINDTEIEKYQFHQRKSSISMKNTDINEINVFNMVYLGKQDFRQDISLDIKDFKNQIFIPIPSKISTQKTNFDKICEIVSNCFDKNRIMNFYKTKHI